MKVAFLDIDGVLVTLRSMKQNALRLQPNMFDPKCVANFNMLVHENEVQVVISSSWRIGTPLDKLKSDLYDVGLDVSKIIDKTPVISDVERGKEIHQWLSTVGKDVTHFCILDDNRDMNITSKRNLHKYLVQTGFFYGLTEDHVINALEILEVDTSVLSKRFFVSNQLELK